ncbi:MAG TPA: type IX secretion system sortase PorU [Bacteroidales bacterium]|nr:type IX secretion system sortase PorU [Bacteroidales bacterium]
MKRFCGKIIWLLLSLFLANSGNVSSQEGYASGSLLSGGKWFKIAVSREGIYRIDYTKLKQLGLDYPSNPRIYGNNQGQLSYFNDNTATDDLREIPVMLVKGSDNVFNEGDYLLFYCMGPNRWKYNGTTGDFDYVQHNYSDSAYYFITSSPEGGRIVQSPAQVTDAPNYYSTGCDALYMHHVDAVNLIRSGREWYEPISSISPMVVDPGFSNVITSEKVKFDIRVLGRSPNSTIFSLTEGATTLESISVPGVNMLSTTGMYAMDFEVSDSSLPSSASPVYNITFNNNGEPAAAGWVHFLKLHARAAMVFTGKTTVYTDIRSMRPGGITEFTLSSPVQNTMIWDVTDQYNTAEITYTRTGNDDHFRILTDSLRRFIAFTADQVLVPTFRNGQVLNQNLHASAPVDMVIVTHPWFLPYAEKLKELHSQNSGLTSLIVTPEQIYNEFSGGLPDIVAIRNFLRMKYLKQKGTLHPLRYLLLFGDGSYENRTNPPHNPNFIPTYQSQNSTVVVSSFTSDDFYTLLEDGEGEALGTEDIGVGRLPVSDTLQASVMVAKIRRYLGSDGIGNWRNLIAVTADDEDGNTHMMDAEGLYSLLNTTYPDFNIDKIYLDAFKQVTSVNGQSYPDVEKAINDRINTGCLIFDYLGHGNEIGLAAERVVKTEDINSWRNGSRLPLFITATCEFSRFDDIEINPINNEMTGKTAAGEMVILNPDGGGIALMTTTRVVYSAPNYTLNRNILYYAFTRDSAGNSLRLGDIIRLAKVSTGDGMNKRNFLLLGDPAVRLAYPWHGKVVTDSVNSVPVGQPIDSLKALSTITVSGHLESNGGTILTNFNGIVNPVIYDKPRIVTTLANDGGQPMEFEIRNNVLFSGKTRAENGRFSFSFIVPKDIDYTFGNGKISYYAHDGDDDMGGSFSGVTVGGFSKTVLSDNTGPAIKLYLNDTLFKNGGISDSNPLLLALIEDRGGINTTGAGIGHDLVAYLDGDRNNSFVLNNYFETDIDNYMKGTATYPLSDLASGNHTLTLKAWDNFNNSSEAELKFVVKTAAGFILTNLVNYPNPFTSDTKITAEHNRPDDELNIRICIYSMSGQLIKVIQTSAPPGGYSLQPIIWDGNCDTGQRAGRGIYPYTVFITTPSGESTKASGRMIIL